MQTKLAVGRFAVAVAAVACTAQVENPNPASGPGSPVPGGPTVMPGGSGPAPQANDAPVEAPIRRLTRREYNNTVRDLFGEATTVGDAFAGDFDRFGTGYSVGGPVADVDARQLLEAAQSVGAKFATNVARLVPCSAQTQSPEDEQTCAGQFIQTFLPRVFRRPVSLEEQRAFTDYFTKARTELGGSFSDGLRLVVQVALQSPSFLYRWELGPVAPKAAGGAIAFTQHEIASRLSYGLWSSMPDAELFDAAAAGKLSTVAEVQVQTRRMLADPKVLDMFTDFEQHWLGLADLQRLEKDAAVYPAFDAALAAAMVEENKAFVAAILGPSGDGKLASLLTSPRGFVDSKLASVYGLSTGGSGGPVDLDPAQRAGILTHAAFLTAHGAPGGSHPVQRGKWILEKLLCEELPIPPPDVPALSPVSEGVSTRERFAAHSAAACAKGCHDKMDALGFAFEHYDGVGAYRSMDANEPVDASGAIELDGKPVSFANAVELSHLLAVSPTVRSCAVRQLTRYVLRRKEQDGDAGSLQSAGVAFERSSHDLRAAIEGITGSYAFYYRKPSVGEVLQ